MTNLCAFIWQLSHRKQQAPERSGQEGQCSPAAQCWMSSGWAAKAAAQAWPGTTKVGVLFTSPVQLPLWSGRFWIAPESKSVYSLLGIDVGEFGKGHFGDVEVKKQKLSIVCHLGHLFVHT